MEGQQPGVYFFSQYPALFFFKFDHAYDVFPAYYSARAQKLKKEINSSWFSLEIWWIIWISEHSVDVCGPVAILNMCNFNTQLQRSTLCDTSRGPLCSWFPILRRPFIHGQFHHVIHCVLNNWLFLFSL